MISSPAPRDRNMQVNPWIEENCPCTKECPRHGNCFECLANHRDHIHIPPSCVRMQMEQGKEKDGQ